MIDSLRLFTIRAPFLRRVMPSMVQKRLEAELCMNIQPPERVEAVLQQLLSMGIRTVRCSWWPWSTAESWSFVTLFRAHGIEIMPVIYPENAFMERGFDGMGIYKSWLRLWNAWGHFPYIQLDNERDGSGRYMCAGSESQRFEAGWRWGAQMTRAAESIHTDSPDVKFVTAGVAWVHDPITPWLRGMISSIHGIHALAIHVYGVGILGEPITRWRTVREAGWKGPIWVTETGIDFGHAAAANRDADEFQLENLQGLTTHPDRYAYHRIFWHQLTWESGGFGLQNTDGSLRPAGQWLASRNG